MAKGNLGRERKDVLDPDSGDGHTPLCLGENLKTVHPKKESILLYDNFKNLKRCMPN